MVRILLPFRRADPILRQEAFGRAVQLLGLRRLLRRRLLPVPPPPDLSPSEPAPPRRQLLLLRGVGLALPVPAAVLHRARLRLRPRHRLERLSAAPEGVPDRQRHRQPHAAGVLQVLQLLPRFAPNPAGSAGPLRRGAPPPHHPAGGDLLLHVPGDVLHHRRLSARDPRHAPLPRLRPLRGVLPPHGGGPDHAGILAPRTVLSP